MKAKKRIEESIRLSKILKPEYERLFGVVDESKGFSLQTIKMTNGDYLVIRHYSRNDYHSEIEDKTLFTSKGKVLRNYKEMGTWDLSIVNTI